MQVVRSHDKTLGENVNLIYGQRIQTACVCLIPSYCQLVHAVGQFVEDYSIGGNHICCICQHSVCHKGVTTHISQTETPVIAAGSTEAECQDIMVERFVEFWQCDNAGIGVLVFVTSGLHLEVFSVSTAHNMRCRLAATIPLV